MTALEIARKIRAHLDQMDRVAGERIGGKPSVCRFLTKTGEKCLLGCLIPNGLYDAAMEEYGFGDLLFNYPALEPEMVPSDLAKGERDVWIVFACELQQCHDSSWSDEGTPETFRASVLAKVRDLIDRQKTGCSFLAAFREAFA